MKTVLFHGPSGSGKDTQVDLLVERYEFESIGTGNMFRTMHKEADLEALRAQQFTSKGQWVPNELVYSMLNRWIKRYDINKDWAFISVVRDPGQVAMFDDTLERVGRKLDAFIYFTLSEEAAIERMSLRWVCTRCNSTYHEKYKQEKVKGYCDNCGTKLEQREDDQPERIKTRIMENNRTIAPILQAYRDRGILIEIDASPGIEEIHKEVVRRLGL
jgi:adenylate kinase